MTYPLVLARTHARSGKHQQHVGTLPALCAVQSNYSCPSTTVLASVSEAVAASDEEFTARIGSDYSFLNYDFHSQRCLAATILCRNMAVLIYHFKVERLAISNFSEGSTRCVTITVMGGGWVYSRVALDWVRLCWIHHGLSRNVSLCHIGLSERNFIAFVNADVAKTRKFRLYNLKVRRIKFSCFAITIDQIVYNVN